MKTGTTTRSNFNNQRDILRKQRAPALGRYRAVRASLVDVSIAETAPMAHALLTRTRDSVQRFLSPRCPTVQPSQPPAPEPCDSSRSSIASGELEKFS